MKHNVKCYSNANSKLKVLEANVLYILHSGCRSLCRSARIANHSTHMSFLCAVLHLPFSDAALRRAQQTVEIHLKHIFLVNL